MSSENTFDYLPYFTEGKVVRGFGRGGAELGIPTANFPEDVIRQLPEEFVCGVYYGWACVNTLSNNVYKMVMCCGWNTHFNNTVKTMETHIMHKFDEQFYGENLRIIVLGYIRPMEAYDSLDALIKAVHNDIHQSDEALSQPTMSDFSRHSFLTRDKTETTTTTPVTSASTEVMAALTLEESKNGTVQSSTSPSFSSSSPQQIRNKETGELLNGAACFHQQRNQHSHDTICKSESTLSLHIEEQKSSVDHLDYSSNKSNCCAGNDCSSCDNTTSCPNDQKIDCDRSRCKRGSSSREQKANNDNNEAVKQAIKYTNGHYNDVVIKNELNIL